MTLAVRAILICTRLQDIVVGLAGVEPVISSISRNDPKFHLTAISENPTPPKYLVSQ